MQLFRKPAALLVLGLVAGGAAASPAIEKLSLTPAGGARVGDKVTATVDFSEPGSGLCAIELEFGDGRRDTYKIKPETKLPLVVEHSYKAPGNFKVRAAGTKVENAFGCVGKEIAIFPVEAAPAAAKANSASPCPADWALQGKVGKKGSFTCVPAKGVKTARKPEKMLDCPAGTSYFTKGKTLGCEAG